SVYHPNPPPRTRRRQSPPQAKQESTKFPPLRRRPSPGKEMARLGISWVFPWAWTYSQVCRGPEELEGVRESCRARVEAVRGRTQKRRAARVRSPVRDRTLSRSCPAPKSKNASSAEFVGRFRFGEPPQVVIKGKFHGFVGAKAVGSSGHHSDFVVEAFHSAIGDFAFGPKPIQDQWFMGA